MSNETERRVYSLSTSHYFEWADVEDLVPKAPEIPETLRPLYPTGETVEHVDDLLIHAYHDEEPRFSEGDLSVEATPQELAKWQAAWASAQQAQQTFRQRLEWARRAYEAAAREALADLGEAMKPWEPVEAELKSRAAELAAKLHVHRVAAEEWKAKKEAEEQAHLDTIHGPRVIALYRPKSLSSYNTADHVAKVHLVTCTRRAKMPARMGERHNDEGLRAGEVWERLTRPSKWLGLLSDREDGNLRVKFCASCKPWTVFQEHIDDFPRPQLGRLGEVRLTDVPDAWTSKEAS